MTIIPTPDSLSMDQRAQYAYRAGFRGQSLAWILAISQRESQGKAAAYNPNVSTGDNSVGEVQINILGNNAGNIARILGGLGYQVDAGNHEQMKALLSNPQINFQVAYKLSNGGTNFEPWRSNSPGWGGPQGFLTNATQYLPEATSAAAHAGMGNALGATLMSQKITQAQQGNGSTYTKMIGFLNSQLGKPYQAGATQVGGVDQSGWNCSSLVAGMYKSIGVTLPALTFTMKDYGVPVPFNQMQPGDMVFKHGAQGAWGHVGVYIGNGKVIAAPHTGAFVEVEDAANWQSDAANGGVRRIVDSQGRLITGAGNLMAPHDPSVGTVPLGQALNDPSFSTSGMGLDGTVQPLNLNITGSQPTSPAALPKDSFALPTHDFGNVLPGLGKDVLSLV